MIKQGIIEILRGGTESFEIIVGEVFTLFSNIVTWGLGLIISWIFMLTGGEDKVIVCLLFLMVIDYLTGVLKATHNKEVSSQKGFKGFIKK